MGGVASFKLALILANSLCRFFLDRGLSFAANAALVRGMGVLAGPPGMAISAVMTVPMISGPAYRVTGPSVVFVAYLRQKYLNADDLL